MCVEEDVGWELKYIVHILITGPRSLVTATPNFALSGV